MALLNRKGGEPGENPPVEEISAPEPLVDEPLEASTETGPVIDEAAEPQASAAPAAADDLLQMFADGHDGGEDRSLLLDMAQDIGIVDLLDELQTIAASLSILRTEAEEQEALAA